MGREKRSKTIDVRLQWGKSLIVGIVILVLAGLSVREWRNSQVVGHNQYRFNLAVIERDKGVTFVSIDPVEKSILALPFPTDLAISSRGSGEYSISSLYKLGSYKGEGGKFVRQKIQGFMRVPIPGYLVTSGSLKMGFLKTIFGHSETSLSRFDAMLLLYRANRYRWRTIKPDELVRSGVVENNIYHAQRLQEYVGSRLFDWGIGGSAISVAIVNGSGENGLGSDMAEFLSNLGLDVVIVRSDESGQIWEQSEWQVDSGDTAHELGYIFQNLFGFDQANIAAVPGEYRAKVLIRVGKDARDLF